MLPSIGCIDFLLEPVVISLIIRALTKMFDTSESHSKPFPSCNYDSKQINNEFRYTKSNTF
jgi:hypothetical protein